MPRGVSHSGYYAWRGRTPSTRSVTRAANEIAVKAVHAQARETYGNRRMHRELKEQGHTMSQWQVRSLRKDLGPRCKQAKKFKVTTNSDHELTVAPNLLNQTFAAIKPNEVCVVDITDVWTDEGWLYVAGVKDVFTYTIVSCSRLRHGRAHDQRALPERIAVSHCL